MQNRQVYRPKMGVKQYASSFGGQLFFQVFQAFKCVKYADAALRQPRKEKNQKLVDIMGLKVPPGNAFS
ncbi:MAG: hypothetical protein GTN76_02525 [Candidatus Aenigmarchaeota archaeon]|nr:hypothetical protein [Candidatus Aenigmarchaeota archaeon]